jgi:hypothetical protein
VVIVFAYLPVVALGVLAGYVLTWKIPVAFLVCVGFVVYRGRRNAVAGRSIGRLRVVGELLAVALAAAVIGGLLFGGLGAIFGFAVGFAVRLGEIPVTRARQG